MNRDAHMQERKLEQLDLQDQFFEIPKISYYVCKKM